MYKFLLIAALIACSWAKPGVVVPLSLAYANTPLYAAGGTKQVDIRNNYDGTLTSYTTAPFEFAAPYSNRYVSGVPAAPALAAKYAAARLFSPFSGSLVASSSAPPASPLAASFAAPYTTSYLPAPYTAAAVL